MHVNGCLTCRWMSDSVALKKYSECYWPYGRLPKSILISDIRKTINREHPFTDCPCYEERKADA